MNPLPIVSAIAIIEAILLVGMACFIAWLIVRHDRIVSDLCDRLQAGTLTDYSAHVETKHRDTKAVKSVDAEPEKIVMNEKPAGMSFEEFAALGETVESSISSRMGA
ncbi:MAG: hypothetical protein ABFD54_04475 [Armatimonadota bacterium]